MSSFRPKNVIFSMAALIFASFLLGGCRKATEQDCEKIVDKMIELELKDQGVTDPKTVEVRKTETKAKRRGDLIRSCVGKRVTTSALTCIDTAQHADEITEKCLR